MLVTIMLSSRWRTKDEDALLLDQDADLPLNRRPHVPELRLHRRLRSRTRFLNSTYKFASVPLYQSIATEYDDTLPVQ